MITKEGRFMLVDDGTMPARGFSVRHVKNIELRDVELRGENEDFRPASRTGRRGRAESTHLKLPRAANVLALALGKVKDFSIVQTKAVPDTNIENRQQTTL